MRREGKRPFILPFPPLTPPKYPHSHTYTNNNSNITNTHPHTHTYHKCTHTNPQGVATDLGREVWGYGANPTDISAVAAVVSNGKAAVVPTNRCVH